MRSFSLSDLNRRPGELVDEALVEPVTLTKHGRRQLVMMSARAYDELVGAAEQGQAPVAAPAAMAKRAKKFLNISEVRPGDEEP